MRTGKKIQPSFVKDREIRLTAPLKWEQLSQEQLRYVLNLMVLFSDNNQIKTHMFVRFCKLEVHSRNRFGWKVSYRNQQNKKVVFYLSSEDVTGFLHQFDFVEDYEDMNIRLDLVGKFRAVDILLHGVDFIDYLNAEKYYQLYFKNHADSALVNLARILYRDDKGGKAVNIRPSAAELVGCFLWFSYVKGIFSRSFTYFFKRMPATDNEEYDSFDILEAMNAQIRALTGGDVTKEKEVLHLDCWRALTELDAKAREAQEMKEQMKKYETK